MNILFTLLKNFLGIEMDKFFDGSGNITVSIFAVFYYFYFLTKSLMVACLIVIVIN
jgi:hypothetical protein